MHQVCLGNGDVSVFRDAFALSVGIGDSQRNIVIAWLIVIYSCWILFVGGTRCAAFELPFPICKVGSPGQVGEIYTLPDGNIGVVGFEIWNDVFASKQFYVLNDGFVVRNGKGDSLWIIAVS